MEKYTVQPLDLMQFINTKYHEPFIHARMELEGTLDETRLTEAVVTLITAFPILKCRYDGKGNVFVNTENLTGKDLLKTDRQASREELLTESLDMGEKLIQFTISENTLYVTVSHLVCDGAGFKHLLCLLCDIYNGTFHGGCEYLMERDLSQLTKDLGGGTGTLSMLLAMMGNYKNHPVYAKSEEEHPCLIERVISKEVMEQAHAAAKQRGATLNDVFLAAYARALSRLQGRRKINIPCTVDLRKYARAKTGIANLTGTYNLNIKIAEGESFEKTLSSVSANMEKQKKTRNDIAGPMLLVSKYEKSSLEDFLKLYGGMDTSAYTDYTNLGVLDEKQLYFDGVTVKNAVMYSVMSKAPCFQIAVSTFRGETTISGSFQCAEGEKEKAVRVFDGIISEMQTFVTSSK